VSKFVVLSLACLLITACSQSLVRERSRVANAERVSCRTTTTTGSNMMRTVCTDPAKRKQQEQQARAMIEDERRMRTSEDMRRSMSTRP
jgi:TolA-binding protein